MAEKISVGKKKKIIAGALAGAVVVAGAGVGVGIGLGVGGQDPAPEKNIEFVLSDETGLDTVYGVNGEEIKVSDLQVGDVIQFPKPAQTFINQGDAKEYFVGWAENREHTVPKYFVGEETIEITEDITTLHAIYMKASHENLVFTDIDEETCTVAYNDVAVDEAKGGILVIPNEFEGKRVVAVNAGETVAEALAVIAGTEDSTIKAEQQTIISEALAAMQNKESIKKVVVARGIESVDEYAFYNCTAMTNLSFVDETFVVESSVQGQAAIEIAEESVIESIKNNAFQGCSSLTSITIPAGVEVIGNSAFQNCTALASVVIEEDSKLEVIGDNAFREVGIDEIILPKSVTSLGSEAFYGCSKLANVNFETGIALEKISAAAFRNCTGLKAVKIPASVTVIDVMAFNNCASLESVEVEEGSALTVICSNAFSGISTTENIEKYTISFAHCSNLTEIQHESFRNMGAVKELYFPKELKTISGDHNFADSLLEVCDFGGAESMMEGKWVATFRGCPNLKSIYVPAGIDQLAVRTFENCKSLKEIEFHENTNLSKHSVGYIASLDPYGGDGYLIRSQYYCYLFQGCESLEEITLPMGMQAIDVLTFNGCTSLKKVKFLDPNVQFRTALSGVKSQIFYDCTSLETVEFAEGTTVKCYNWGTRWNGSTQSMVVDFNYNDVANISGLFSGCTSLKYVGIPNAEGVVEENTLPGYTGNIHSYMFADTAIENFTLPTTTQTIAGWAFIGCKELKEIEFPSSLTTIEQRAFEGSGLEHIVISENVTTIGYRAFQQIATLKSITFNCKNLTSVGGDAFQPFYTGEPFVDSNENGVWDEGEDYTDVDNSDSYTMQQPVPSQLTKITFGANVTNINFASGIWANAVASHNNMTTIEFLGDVPTITNMPEFASVTSVIVPAGKLDAYKTAFAFYADKMVEASA